MRNFLIAGLALVAAACGASDVEQTSAAAITITDQRAAPSPGGVDVAAGYLTIRNNTDTEDAIVAVSTPRAERAETHEMAMDGVVMRMRPIARLAIPAGSSVSLEPGGMHLMFYGVDPPFAEGDEIPVTLTFESAGEIETILVVTGPRSHDGH